MRGRGIMCAPRSAAMALIIAILAGCPSEMAQTCRQGDPDVVAADCYATGLTEGFEAGYASGSADGLRSASDECFGGTDSGS